MSPVAVVDCSKLEGAGKSTSFRAMMLVDERRRAGDGVVLVFDGYGITALVEMLAPGTDLHHARAKAAPAQRGACRDCAKRYGVLQALEAAQVPLLADDRGRLG